MHDLTALNGVLLTVIARRSKTVNSKYPVIIFNWDTLNYMEKFLEYLQLIWTNHNASHIPQSPEMRKNVILLSGLGLHTNKVTIRATWRERAKQMTGLRPVILTMLPEQREAIPLHTPKQIITKPMLFIPHPQDTNAYKKDKNIFNNCNEKVVSNKF